MSDRLLWVDLETTGLVPEEGRILEVGMIVTDPHLAIMRSYSSMVYPAVDFEENLPPVVWEMHTNSGLIHDMRYAEKLPLLSEVEDWIISKICNPYFGADNNKIMLAGSSVDFDKKWLAEHMPDLWARLHYRVADVSSMREFIRRWVPDHDQLVVETFGDRPSKHRAMDDLHDSIDLARLYQKWWNA